MNEKKTEILTALGKELPAMKEAEKTYLMGFLEGVAAIAWIGGGQGEKTA